MDTTLDEIVKRMQSGRRILEDNPRSLEILQQALDKAMELARREHRRQTNHNYRLGFRHD